MPVADMIRLGTSGNLTTQQMADMALKEDQLARDARARGDMAAYAIHDAESLALCNLIKESM